MGRASAQVAGGLRLEVLLSTYGEEQLTPRRPICERRWTGW